MLATKEAPFTHGIEIEQLDADLPSGVTARNGTLDNWHRDGSGPMETTIGPNKNAKSILDEFYQGTREEYDTWNWQAGSGSTGCGSHVHICLVDGVFEDEMAAWTIGYNSMVELAPFFAPFWCHNWADGFRNGGRRSGDLTIRTWGKPQTTRWSPSTTADRVNSGRFRREYKSVVFNPRNGSKPVTIEVRMNDAHPAIALTGALYIRRIIGRCIEAGNSPKLADRTVLDRVYRAIYEDAADMGLTEAMRQDIPIVFQEGRGIAGVDRLAFDSPRDLLKALLRAYPQTAHTWSYRVGRLVSHGRDDCGPQANPDAVWRVDAPIDAFQWDAGPEVR